MVDNARCSYMVGEIGVASDNGDGDGDGDGDGGSGMWRDWWRGS
jgi:hypothetical protein